MPEALKCISVEKAREYQDIWEQSRAKELEAARGYEDTRDFWYSLGELEEYLDYMKEESEKQGVKKPGVRIYFGSYPKTNQKKSYSTVFLAPTKGPSGDDEENAGNQDNKYKIDPLNLSTGGYPQNNY